jgi:hypothetical protein
MKIYNIMNKLRYLENLALSNQDIEVLTEKECNIVLYPDLYKYKSLDEMLGIYEACILLFEAKPRYGHWTLIFKTKEGGIEFFNPYGGYPDESLKYISQKFRKESHQNMPYLSQLLINSRYELSYNEFKFQKLSSEIKTCGRHCVVRLWCRDLDLYQYVRLLNTMKKKYKKTYDEMVTILTSK